jgi:dTDP-4-dehydrorhamnose reductase
MKILITGANGLVARYLNRELLGRGHVIMATGLGSCRLQDMKHEDLFYGELDIRDAEAVFRIIHEVQPDWIIHNAAWAQPDQCELNQVGAWDINVTATRFLLEAAREAGSRFLFMSTDFVFDGKNGPYRETDPTGPVNYYGCTKRVAEKAVINSGLRWIIVRTVLVYGQHQGVQRFNLLTWVRDKLAAGERIKVVSDQYRTPTYAGDLALGIRLAIEKDQQGIFHISGNEFMTPYHMAMATAQALGLDAELIEQVNASNFTQPAIRPAKTGFIIDKAKRDLNYSPLAFKDGLLEMLNEDPA